MQTMKLSSGLRVFWSLIRVVLGPFVSLLLLGVVILTLPFVVVWRVVVGCICHFDKRVGRILSPMDVLVYEEFGRVVQNSLVVVLELEGAVGLDEIVSVFEERVLVGDGNGGFVYPELRQFVGDYLGFKVFKWVDGFCVDDHFCEVEEGGGNVHEVMMNRVYSRNASPWEVCLFDGGRVVGFRVHHCVADGLSVLKVFCERVGGKVVVKAGARVGDGGVYELVVCCVRVVVGVGWAWVGYWMSFVFGGREEFMVEGVREESFVGVGGVFSVEKVRGVGKEGGVCGSSVLIAGVLGGLGKFMDKEVGCNVKTMECGYVLPVQGHPGSLCNHWRTAYTTISIEDAKNYPSLYSLRRYNKLFLSMKHSARTFFLKYSIDYAGSLVYPMTRFFLRNRVTGAGITNVAGDDEGFEVCGRGCVGYSLCAGGLPGVGLMFCIMSYKRGFRVCCVADSRILSREQVNVLSGYIDKEFWVIFGGDGGGTCLSVI